MHFIELPLFARFPQERGELQAQRAALMEKFKRGARTSEVIKDDDASVVRRLLIDLVKAGAIEPKEADAEFRLLGRGPLIATPDPSQFDPMLEAHWTFTMALAWIMWGSLDDVRRHWEKWREQVKDWYRSREHGDLSIHSLKPTSFDELRHDALMQEKDNRPRISIDQARQRLWQALQNEKLKAFAIDQSNNKRVRIEGHEFVDLQLVTKADVDCLDPGPYRKPSLSRAEVMRLWRKRPSRSASLISADDKCYRWLVLEMKKSPNRKPASRTELKKMALAEIKGLSGEGFDRAWKRALTETGASWNRPGRPPKSGG